MPKVLLTTLNAKYIHLNLAIRILYDLYKDKCDLSFKEFVIKNDKEEIAQYCSDYDVVCFSCYIWNITPTLAVCECLKQLNPAIKILLGGPEVSYDFHEIIALDYVDYIIAGEGEIPFAAFVEQFPVINQVPNLVYKENGSIQYNKQEVQFDVALLADRNPYQYDAPSDLNHKVCYIETSRGCPYKCEFCLASLDNKVRYLPMQTIKDNLLYLMQNGRTIKFLDRTFNIKKDFTLALFDFILKNHRPENVFQFEITADIVHPEIITYVNEFVPKGLFRFEIGIQTVNQKSNLEVKRKQNFEKTAGIIKQLDTVVEMHLDLIVGLPFEYMDDLKFSFESVFKLHPPELQLGFLKFLKGTPVRERYAQYGYEFDWSPPYQIIKSDFLSKAELESITYLEAALEIYWNKKRIVPSLQYVAANYSIFDFLMELGKYFKSRADLHKHTLKDIFAIVFAFAGDKYKDEHLLSLLCIDYFTYAKVKPNDIYDKEVPKTIKSQLIDAHHLNHHTFRFAIIPITFDYAIWETQHKIVKGAFYIIVQYDGVNKSKIVKQVLVENFEIAN